ncbi:MAG: UDP-N-acetylglucosamine--N-acetylmuramyl-(pentapeptide) pyrophosphoryl-undecaprenol N-acetylglucosamine transferase [Firmicutes bacterium]|nr:UDP-N-acetylglucosamine--N-acetylmuramyl-(pentapeptide) pyrophosphoryl-undecaprenol N-acetylglucosamine transferase [Bacillota bacterium]
MERIVLTGGGTAGHIVPNLALLPHLHDFELHYIGQKASMEEELVKQTDPRIIFHPLECVKFNRKLSLKLLALPFKLLASKNRAKQILREIKPKVIFSKGGFVSLPVMLAAGKTPLILHESDFSMGLANRMGAKKSAVVCTSFAPLAAKTKNGLCTGAPLRAEIYTGSRFRAEQQSGLRGRKSLLIMGGSSGAKAINDAVAAVLEALCERFDVVHITGKNYTPSAVHPRYYPIPFTTQIADYFAWADFCVTRGGANALFELAALAIPSIVVPLPKGISRGDQIENAAYFESKGCMRVLDQLTLTKNPAALLSALDILTENRAAYRAACKKAAHIDGTAMIAQLIRDMVIDNCIENHEVQLTTDEFRNIIDN